MAQDSKAMSQSLNLSRQRNQTLIFVSQEARQVDKNIASSASVVVFKELGILQPEFDRPELRKLVAQATEALLHASQAGEEVTSLGGRVSLGIGKLVGTHHDHADEIMEELVLHERSGIENYEGLLSLVEGKHVSLEEYARQMIRAEELHVNEILKMLRKRGDA